MGCLETGAKECGAKEPPAAMPKKRAARPAVAAATTARPAAGAARTIVTEKEDDRLSPSPFSPLLEPGQEAAGGMAKFELVNGVKVAAAPTLQPEQEQPADTRKRAEAQPAQKKKSHKKRKTKFKDHIERPDGLEEGEDLKVFWVSPRKAARQEAVNAPVEEQVDFAQYGGAVCSTPREGGPVVLPGVLQLPASQYDDFFSQKPWQPPAHYVRCAPVALAPHQPRLSRPPRSASLPRSPSDLLNTCVREQIYRASARKRRP